MDTFSGRARGRNKSSGTGFEGVRPLGLARRDRWREVEDWTNLESGGIHPVEDSGLKKGRIGG